VELILFVAFLAIGVLISAVAVYTKNIGFGGLAAAILILLGVFAMTEGILFTVGEIHVYDLITDLTDPNFERTTGTINITYNKDIYAGSNLSALMLVVVFFGIWVFFLSALKAAGLKTE